MSLDNLPKRNNFGNFALSSKNIKAKMNSHIEKALSNLESLLYKEGLEEKLVQKVSMDYLGMFLKLEAEIRTNELHKENLKLLRFKNKVAEDQYIKRREQGFLDENNPTEVVNQSKFSMDFDGLS